jgi:predicted transcriptional regulator
MGFSITKEEFYKKLIDIHKKCGQGLSGIVRVQSSEIDRYLDELIEEGLVICCDTGGSIGHPESNRFYMQLSPLVP